MREEGEQQWTTATNPHWGFCPLPETPPKGKQGGKKRREGGAGKAGEPRRRRRVAVVE
jgi:hypothetical protein